MGLSFTETLERTHGHSATVAIAIAGVVLAIATAVVLSVVMAGRSVVPDRPTNADREHVQEQGQTHASSSQAPERGKQLGAAYGPATVEPERPATLEQAAVLRGKQLGVGFESPDPAGG